MTALHVGALSGDDAVMEALLQQARREEIDRTDEEGRTPLHHACASGSFMVVQRLLNCGADTEAGDKHGDKPVQLAARAGHIAVVKALLRPQRSAEESAPPSVGEGHGGHHADVDPSRAVPQEDGADDDDEEEEDEEEEDEESEEEEEMVIDEGEEADEEPSTSSTTS